MIHDAMQADHKGMLKSFAKRSIMQSFLILSVLSLSLLSACGGGNGAAPATATIRVPRFAYVTNASSNTVSMYTVDNATGKLRHNGYIATGSNPMSVTVSGSIP